MTQHNLTPRNGLPAGNLYNHTDAPIELDTLYEICDAEFNSDKEIHRTWRDLEVGHKKFDGLFARYLIPKVQSVARREKLHKVDGMFPSSLVAKRISQDWKERKT